MVQWLVCEEGADVNPVDRHQRTPLEVRRAAGRRRCAIVWSRPMMHGVRATLIFALACVNRRRMLLVSSTQEAARNDHSEVVKILVANKGRVFEDNQVRRSGHRFVLYNHGKNDHPSSAPLVQLMELEKSRLNGICNMRRSLLSDMGWDPEWEVNPKEVHLMDKIGEASSLI